ncbi:hypothetical protein QE152_g33485 [Popillia japonica]|uniref:DUF4219 domain-containing protein n=1 Tax=Popillia japonica TaxID=7064 RepID=A0AAW1IX81_POPJA
MDELKIEKLNSENYRYWCLRAQGLLEVTGLWQAIEPGLDDDISKWSSQDKEIDHKTNLDDIMECKTAKDIWKTLKEIHTKYDEWHGLLLLQDFVTTKKKNDESINEYLFIQNTTNGMACYCFKILLPPKRRTMKASMNIYRAYAAKSTKYFKRKPQRGSDEKKPNRESKSYENLRCYRCLEFDHIGRYCKGDNKPKEPDGQTKIAFQTMMRVDSEAYLTNDPYFKTDKNSWILDSGSTDHITCAVINLNLKISRKRRQL